MFSLNGLLPSCRSAIARSRLSSSARTVTLGAFVFALGACGEISAVEVPLTLAEIEETKSGVSDTQDRLMTGISSEAIRKEVGADLDALTRSVASGNSAEVRMLARRAATTLATYYLSSDRGDGPDISAMLLMLNSVARIAGSTSDDISL